MPIHEDWLGDPLKKSEQQFGYVDLLPDVGRNESWKHYHLAARIKLEGAAYHCRHILGSASMTPEIGAWDINSRMMEWYLDAFFFELMSAYEVVLQELNILYAKDSSIGEEEVRWASIKPLLGDNLAESMQQVRDLLWFKKLKEHRNRSAHRSHTPLASWSAGFGGRIWEHDAHGISMAYTHPESEQLELESVVECRTYLKAMLDHICDVWQRVADDFDILDTNTRVDV